MAPVPLIVFPKVWITQGSGFFSINIFLISAIAAIVENIDVTKMLYVLNKKTLTCYVVSYLLSPS